jgi:23S rRNA (adenine2503-C2)-methyltransferase
MGEIENILIDQPKYRREQIYRAWFNPKIKSFGDMSDLPKDLREVLSNKKWMPANLKVLQKSKIDDTQKALLVFEDGQAVETVLMPRKNKKLSGDAKSRHTVCLSSQVGCPMGCLFCATGRQKFSRNLTAEEIIAQYRFWNNIVGQNNNSQIDNLVFMGQGEPLLNYQEVKKAINLILKFTAIGPTKITISTVGIKPAMEKLIEDDDFPPVRFALSLHSAIFETRKKLIPSHTPEFFDFLIKWSKKYHRRFPSRTHFIGLEYILINNFNDSDRELKALIKLASKLGRVRINLIPLNICGKNFDSADETVIKKWQNKLMESGFVTTVRLSQGADINAACGQLISEYGAKK